MKLKSIFSDGALLLQNNITEFKGQATPNAEITCSLLLGEKIIRTEKATAEPDGAFSVPLLGEAASYKKYTVKFECQNESVTINDVLFGEIWLAAGQSNMEMPNFVMENCAEFLSAAEKFELRAYRFVGSYTDFKNPPFEEAFDTDGIWRSSKDKESFAHVSAAAASAALVVAEHFAEEGKEIPVGIVDISIGGTSIETWLPLEYADGIFKERLIKLGRFTDDNARKLGYKELFSANSIYYNALVPPLFGIKLRGMLWYQGESNVNTNPLCRSLYKEELETLQNVYAEKFSPSDDKKFPLICSLLFPWIYDLNGNIALGHINLAMSDAANSNPEKIFIAPIHDLPAKWSYFYDYHPIHPTNKYGVGERLGGLMLTNMYDASGIKTAAFFKRATRKKGYLDLHFETFGRPLTYEGTRLKGFHVCGKAGTFVPADAEIISRTTVRVSNEYIASPSGVCYQVADMENDGNLMCDGLPVAPFTTVTEPFSVVLKPWLFADTDSCFGFGYGINEPNVFNYPVRFPSESSYLNYDPAYNAVRITAAEGATVCGMYVKANKTMPLDLQRYTALVFTVYARPEISASVKLTLKKGDEITERVCKAYSSSKPGTGIVECKVPFKVSDDTVVEKLEILLDVSRLTYPTAAVGNLKLVPKRACKTK